MDSVSGCEGPVILQLHKWNPSQPQLNLSEYHEAFISPTRQNLLLHSYKHEALLLPLNTGKSPFPLSFDMHNEGTRTKIYILKASYESSISVVTYGIIL